MNKFNFKVEMDVFGVFTHGKNAGKVNPKALVHITMFGETVREAIGKMVSDSLGAFYKVTNVEEGVF